LLRVQQPTIAGVMGVASLIPAVPARVPGGILTMMMMHRIVDPEAVREADPAADPEAAREVAAVRALHRTAHQEVDQKVDRGAQQGAVRAAPRQIRVDLQHPPGDRQKTPCSGG